MQSYARYSTKSTILQMGCSFRVFGNIFASIVRKLKIQHNNFVYWPDF